MKITNVLENIKADDVISVRIDTGVYGGKPILCVGTCNQGEVQHPLTNGIEVFYSNEFLRSLNLMPDELIGFGTYPLYDRTVHYLNRLIEIKRAMETVTNKPYKEIDILANRVYETILNRLLAKHHLASDGFDAAMKKRPLKEWVAEALAVIS